MTRKPLLTSLAGAVILAVSGSAWAWDTHSDQAIEHAAQALAHGQDNHAPQATQHAQEALAHAQAAEKYHDAATTHVKEAVNHLNQAIEHGKMGHAEIAAQHSDEAMNHLKMARLDSSPRCRGLGDGSSGPRLGFCLDRV